MTRAFFGLGSNLGDRWGHLQHAVDGLAATDRVIGISSVFETDPVGGPDNQGPYLNCVVAVESDRSPQELLETANRLEAERGRVRAERFGPRTLDVDVLLVEGVVSDDPKLTIPHPRMTDRAFVLAPLEQLDPTRVPPGWRERLTGDLAGVRRVGELLHLPGAPGR